MWGSCFAWLLRKSAFLAVPTLRLLGKMGGTGFSLSPLSPCSVAVRFESTLRAGKYLLVDVLTAASSRLWKTKKYTQGETIRATTLRTAREPMNHINSLWPFGDWLLFLRG